MPRHGKPAGANGGPSEFDQLSRRDRAEDSPKLRGFQHHRPPHTVAIMDAVAGALADLEPADQPRLLEWVASRGLLGLAHLGGHRAAAQVAYRFADELASGVQ